MLPWIAKCVVFTLSQNFFTTHAKSLFEGLPLEGEAVIQLHTKILLFHFILVLISKIIFNKL